VNGGIAETIIFWTFMTVILALFLKDYIAADKLTGSLSNAYVAGVGALGALG
jgi:hypothetical protein